MSITSCPSCGVGLRVEAVTGPAEPVKGSALSHRELRSVYDFMSEIGAGRHESGSLYETYSVLAEARGWPELTQAGFGRALRRNGATSWRGARGRGWVLPEVLSAQPAKPAPSVLKTEERNAYSDAQVASILRQRDDRLEPPAEPARVKLPWEM